MILWRLTRLLFNEVYLKPVIPALKVLAELRLVMFGYLLLMRSCIPGIGQDAILYLSPVRRAQLGTALGSTASEEHRM